MLLLSSIKDLKSHRIQTICEVFVVCFLFLPSSVRRLANITVCIHGQIFSISLQSRRNLFRTASEIKKEEDSWGKKETMRRENYLWLTRSGCLWTRLEQESRWVLRVWRQCQWARWHSDWALPSPLHDVGDRSISRRPRWRSRQKRLSNLNSYWKKYTYQFLFEISRLDIIFFGLSNIDVNLEKTEIFCREK